MYDNIITVDMNRKVSMLYKLIHRFIGSAHRVDLEKNLPAGPSANVGRNDYTKGYIDAIWRTRLDEYDLSVGDGSHLNVKFVLAPNKASLAYYFGAYEGFKDYIEEYGSYYFDKMSVTIVGIDDEIDRAILELINKDSELSKQRDEFLDSVYDSSKLDIDTDSKKPSVSIEDLLDSYDLDNVNPMKVAPQSSKEDEASAKDLDTVSADIDTPEVKSFSEMAKDEDNLELDETKAIGGEEDDKSEK